jgi:cyclophilin family peptidyl-prolyl cis-trans isomerase
MILAGAAVALGACGSAGSGSTTATAGRAATAAATTPSRTATATTSTTAPSGDRASTIVKPRSTHDGCEAVPTPVPRSDTTARRSRKRLRRDRTYTAIVRTNCGTIRIRLAVKRSPKTTASFAGLAHQRFFDDLEFQRVAHPGGSDYVIQGGDPLLDNDGGPGYSVVEPPPKSTRYVRYVVAMAKTQTDAPGTSGSQFFIVTAKEVPLDPIYAVLGLVTGGKNVVRRIAALDTDPTTEQPIDPVVIGSVRIRISK